MGTPGRSVKEDGMARPRNFDIDDATAALLDVFWRKGYASASLRDLCEATGQRSASLYAAFGDKDQMFRAAIQRYVSWIEDELTPAEDGPAGVRHILETTCRLTLEDDERRGCPVINSVAERDTLSAGANTLVAESFARLRALFARQIEASRSPASPPDAAAMVSLLVGATISIRLLGRAGAPPEILRDTVAGAEDAFRRWATSDVTA
jgi:TetR/AcrR family transcriptional repressor of nem operon